MGENCVEDYHVDGVVEVSAITQPIRSFTSKEGGRIQDYIVVSQSRELWRLLSSGINMHVLFAIGTHMVNLIVLCENTRAAWQLLFTART